MSKRCKNIKPTGDYVNVFNNLKDLYISSYRWLNLPETINPRFLELSLFDYGKVVFFEDELIGHLALKATLAGKLDHYYEPTQIHAYGGNGYQKTIVNHKTGVIIYNNAVRDVPIERIKDYAIRISAIEKTIDVNIHQQKTPYIVKGNKKQQLTLRNFYKQYDEFEPQIFINDDLDVENISALPTLAPFVTDKLEVQKRKLWNEALSFIGIENNFSEKNERLTMNEVMVSNGLAIANRTTKLETRQNAVDEINKMFGLDIQVEVNNISILDVDFNGEVKQ